MAGPGGIMERRESTWWLALLGSMVIHATVAALVLQVVPVELPRRKVVVPVEPLTLTTAAPGQRGGGGGETAAPRLPEPPPPPPPREKPKVVKKPPKAPPKPVLPEPPPQLAIPVPVKPPPVVAPKPAPAQVAAVPGTAAGRPGSGPGRGSGTGTGAGTGTGPGSGTGSGGPGSGTGNPLKGYLSEVRRLLDRNKHYPPMARRQHQEGVVVLRFTIAASGRVEATSVQRSCGHALLDQEAQETVRRVRAFPPFPPGLDRDRITIEIPLAFRLMDG